MHTPSPYQAAIYAHTTGHAAIIARAGAGKTYTVEQCIKQSHPYDGILYSPFTKSVADEAERKLRDFPNATVATLNKLGFRICRENAATLGCKSLKVERKKNEKILESYLSSNDWNKFGKYIASKVSRAVDLLKDLAYDLEGETDPKEVTIVLEEYDLIPEDFLNKQCDITALLFEIWHIVSRPWNDMIDFADQLYLPWKFNLRPPRFAKVYIDEAQDLNRINWLLIMRIAERAQVILIGDPMQCIFDFRGANYHAMERQAHILNATPYSLPVCYRCGTDIIKLAQKIVPDIQSPDGMHRGQVSFLSSLSTAAPGDVVIARKNATLISAAWKLRFEHHQSVYVRGDGTREAIETMVKKSKINMGDDSETALDKLDSWHMHKTASLPGQVLPVVLQPAYDALVELLTQFSSAGSALTFLDEIFSTEPGPHTITLSTIHRFKGQEAERVFYVNPNLDPEAPHAEKRIAYVGITRAIKQLNLVSLKGS